MSEEWEWDFQRPSRPPFRYRMLALALYIYTVALGLFLIIQPELVCGSVAVAVSIILVWAVLLTILIVGEKRSEGTKEQGEDW